MSYSLSKTSRQISNDEYEKKDILYYDFSLNVGDTFAYNIYDTLIVTEVIEQYDRPGLRLQTLNNPYLGYYWTINWVQGIGSLSGIEHPIGEYGCSRELICFYHDSFNPIDCSRFDEVLVIKESISNELKIFPNPSSSILNIVSANDYISEINLYSIDCRKRIIDNNTVNSNTETLDISYLENGIYFLIIKSNSGIITRKFIKE